MYYQRGKNKELLLLLLRHDKVISCYIVYFYFPTQGSNDHDVSVFKISVFTRPHLRRYRFLLTREVGGGVLQIFSLVSGIFFDPSFVICEKK